MKGFKEEEKIWKKEIEESNDKVFDKSVANALANNNIDTTKIIDETHNWLTGDYSTLLYVDMDEADFIETNHFHRCIDALTDTEDVNTLLFHKESKRKFGGMYTRRSPRPFIMVGYKDHIGEKKKQLLKTKYYDKLNNEEYDILNSKPTIQSSYVKQVAKL